MRCPDFEQLIDYADGKLAPAEGATVQAHLANCDHCAESRLWYERVRAIAQSDDSIAPPAWVLKRAVRIFDGTPSRPQVISKTGPRTGHKIGQMIATLVFDSLVHPQLAGVRSTETSSRQLLYRADDYCVDVQVAPASMAGATTAGNGADLIGQVLREGETTFESVTGLRLEISRDGNPVHTTVTDQVGEFKIRNVVYGVYDLRVEVADGQITIPGLPVTPV